MRSKGYKLNYCIIFYMDKKYINFYKKFILQTKTFSDRWIDQGVTVMKEVKEKKKNVWNYTLIVVVTLGIIVGYLSYLQDKKMDKMEEELDRKKMEQIDPIV